MSRIAVVVPHFRQAEFLAACLDCLLAQARRPDDIIVIDSSPSDTAAIVARYGAPVRHIASPATGVGAARNQGLHATDCDLVAFLDADNLAAPDCLSRHARAFDANPDAVLCHGALTPIDRNGDSYDGLTRYDSEQVPFLRQLGWLLERNRVATDTVCVRRHAVMSLGGFCEVRGVREDYDLWLRLAATGPFVYIDAPLASYRRHETNLSNDAGYMHEWEAGALRRVDWATTRRALHAAFPDQAQRTLVEGEVRLRRGESGAAQRCFRTLLNGPQAAAAMFHLAHLALDRHDLDAAERLLRRATREHPSDAGLWNNFGVLLATRGHRSEAGEAFTSAADLRACYDDARRNLEQVCRGAAGEWRVTRRRLRPVLLPLASLAGSPSHPNHHTP